MVRNFPDRKDSAFVAHSSALHRSHNRGYDTAEQSAGYGQSHGTVGHLLQQEQVQDYGRLFEKADRHNSLRAFRAVHSFLGDVDILRRQVKGIKNFGEKAGP